MEGIVATYIRAKSLAFTQISWPCTVEKQRLAHRLASALLRFSRRTSWGRVPPFAIDPQTSARRLALIQELQSLPEHAMWEPRSNGRRAKSSKQFAVTALWRPGEAPCTRHSSSLTFANKRGPLRRGETGTSFAIVRWAENDAITAQWWVFAPIPLMVEIQEAICGNVRTIGFKNTSLVLTSVALR
jgi:hypothetical protein